jgi:hypothetical protein
MRGRHNNAMKLTSITLRFMEAPDVERSTASL